MDSDILYIQVVDRKIVVHTTSGVVEGSLSKQLEFILSRFGYERVCQVCFANMDQVVDYDEIESKLYFDKKVPIYCLVSRRNKYKVMRYFDKKGH